MRTWVFWVGLFLVVDAAIDLWALNWLQERFPQLNVRKIALMESLIGLILLIVYFVSKGMAS